MWLSRWDLTHPKVKNSRENTIYINVTSSVYNGESHKGLFWGLI